MPTRAPKDPGHWLYRLTVEEWLAAAEHELRLCEEALGRRAFRPGVTLARRAVGMAWNAVLVAASPGVRASEESPGSGDSRDSQGSQLSEVSQLSDAPPASQDFLTRYGRSYMEHIAALAADDGLPPEVREAARALRDTPAAPPELVTIGKANLAPFESARRVIAYARTRAVTTN
jgi:hypothetical protein